ncbi:MAG TPA: LamG domain-containing protein [Chitinophagaceae bacterium]|nr:LamG domain-containing protein [Chitinophagaceae bacterium]
MKKHFLILATSIITLVFVSCSKEKIENGQPVINEEIATAKGGSSSAVPGKDLEAWFKFNGNLKDATGKLEAIPTTNGADVYTDDRMGNPEKAIKFTGRYGLEIPNVPSQSKMSVAAWIKFVYDSIQTFHVVYGWGGQPTLGQVTNHYYGAISTPGTTSVLSNPMDNNWHHLVATYDETNLKFYVDGNYVGSSFNPSQSWSGALFPYYVAGFSTTDYWEGSLDDLVIYTRTLSPVEVQKLYNQ